ncbi:palmitoyltransferase [Ascosphaera acerosa]|nr:palmitoyltransferase [Ascosphaera acerosa]
MKIYHMGIYRNETRPAIELCGEKDLSSFSRFTRDRAHARRPAPEAEADNYTFHAYSRSEGICALIISDHEYPKLVAHQILSKLADEFLVLHPRTDFLGDAVSLPLAFPALPGYIVKYQDPAAADSIMKIQQELDETKIVLHSTIKSVLERGESIDRLVEKSDGLSWQSKQFYTQAKKQNSCCVLM